jgi:hypothetical protein
VWIVVREAIARACVWFEREKVEPGGLELPEENAPDHEA